MSQPSSPVLKARRQSHKRYSRMLYSILAVCFSIWLIRLVFFRSRPLDHSDSTSFEGRRTNGHSIAHPLLRFHAGQPSLLNDTQHITHAKPVNNSLSDISLSSALSLTAILPLPTVSIASLDSLLRDLLGVSPALGNVVLLSPRPNHSRIRHALRTVLSEENHLDVEFSITHWPEAVDQDNAVIQAAQRATSDWVLLMDEKGLQGFASGTRNFLLLATTPAVFLPVGPRGVSSRLNGASCLAASSTAQEATYLVPPFVLPVSLLPSSTNIGSNDSLWRALGDHISHSSKQLSGGLVLGSSDTSLAWCRRYVLDLLDDTSSFMHTSLGSSASIDDDNGRPPVGTTHSSPRSGTFLLAAHASDAHYLANISCELARRIHNIIFLVFHDVGDSALDQTTYTEECRSAIQLVPLSPSMATDPKSLLQLLSSLAPEYVDVVISGLEDAPLSQFLTTLSIKSDEAGRPITTVEIPRKDMPFCDWMLTLDLDEWKSWHVPRIELSVITDTRPHSLHRLLSSLTNARYFGDKPNLRINLEQTADPETLRMVNEFKWEPGNVFLHHRVVHGGLMTAVVESWYPRNNDSYGLILEDDVELSPLFYAWVKLSLLRYRYSAEDRSPNLFGISLYQQKNLELRPEGRHVFDARHTFSTAGIPHPNTPYLSQIPCSWGALYFPEHWREFQAYLAARLSSAPWPLSEAVVPDVRSNRWTRSWKRYFIELVFLRGYVMLYPNYAGFRSLSTNHLEVGSHVKDIPVDAYLRKKKLFNVPLMSLPPVDDAAGLPATGLLELPGGFLPEWESLPILDLLGTIVDQHTLTRRGRERRTELTGCDGIPSQANDVQELLCMR